MPEYLPSTQGEFQNEMVRIPATFNHMNQFLYTVKDEHWKHIQDAARQTLGGEIEMEHKIKPSSLKLIRDNKAFDCIAPHLKEHVSHHDPSSEVHKGGGIHEAIESLLQVVGGWFGGKKVNQWVAGEKKRTPITGEQKTLAKILQATYKDKRLEEVDGWVRVDNYDTQYGSIWKNPWGGVYSVGPRNETKF